MTDLDLLDQYEEALLHIKGLLEQPDLLPERFCLLVPQMESLSSQDPQIQARVKDLFYDVNEQIQAYQEQFQILVEELGILCRTGSPQQKEATRFFTTLVDLLQLAFSTYQEDPDRLAPFLKVLERLRLFLTKQTKTLSQDPLSDALLLSLVQSAWAFTSPQTSPQRYAAQIQTGGARTKTRKRNQKRSA
jgi:methylphosphotriester-DNA--protein-cysteine methyltransferase